MPNRDGTGPMSMGPLTGRGAGYCAGGRRTAGAARGFGCGFGRGRGYRRTGYIAASAAGSGNAGFDEREALAARAEFLEDSLRRIRERISAWENPSE